MYSYQAYKHHKKTKYADQHITGNLMPAAAVLTQRWYRLTSRAQLSCPPPPHTHTSSSGPSDTIPIQSPYLVWESNLEINNIINMVMFSAKHTVIIHITTSTFDAGYLCKIQANSNPEMTWRGGIPTITNGRYSYKMYEI